MSQRNLLPACLAVISALGTAAAQVLGPYVPPPAAPSESLSKSQPPRRLTERLPIPSPVVLRSAEEGAGDQLDAMEAWNTAGRLPMRVGFSRNLPEPITAAFGIRTEPSSESSWADPHAVRAQSAGGLVVWATKVTVQKAYAIRLHLTNVQLPTATRFWTYGTDGPPITFGLELLDSQKELWTPSAFGETVSLEVQIPAGHVGWFTIGQLAEIIRPSESTAAHLDCFQDATCVSPSTFSAIRQAQKAVAQLQFVYVGNPSACTGTLLNNTRSDGTPYLLTAQHCLPTEDAVSTLEVFWDYFDATCDGVRPDLATLPRSNGGTLLAAKGGTGSDFALVRLASVPVGRAFLGWDARSSSLSDGTKLYRVSHPYAFGGLVQQSYSESLVDPDFRGCEGFLRPDFIYSARLGGALFGGCSGSAAMLETGQVVGQLTGTCTEGALFDPCSQAYFATDGAFSRTYSAVSQWLSPPGELPQPCHGDANTLCLSDNRFRVQSSYRNSIASGQGTAVPLSASSGFFTFDNADSIELVVKVLNACAFDPHIWVFAGGLTNQEVTLTVTDTKTGAVRFYYNASGTTFTTITDTTAFSTCP